MLLQPLGRLRAPLRGAAPDGVRRHQRSLRLLQPQLPPLLLPPPGRRCRAAS